MKLINFLRSIFTKKFWVSEFPNIPDDECFMCNKQTCEGCPVVPLPFSSEEWLHHQARSDSGTFLS
jgi:hypothetical protein